MDNNENDESRLYDVLSDMFFKSLNDNDGANPTEIAYIIAKEAGLKSPNNFQKFILERIEKLKDEKSNDTEHL